MPGLCANHVYGGISIGTPGSVDRQGTPSGASAEPVADDVAGEQELASCALIIRRPLARSQQGSVSHADGWQIEHCTEMDGESGPAWMVVARGIDQQHIRLLGQRARRGLKGSAYAQRQQAGNVWSARGLRDGCPADASPASIRGCSSPYRIAGCARAGFSSG